MKKNQSSSGHFWQGRHEAWPDGCREINGLPERVRKNLEERIRDGNCYTNKSVNMEDIEGRAMEREISDVYMHYKHAHSQPHLHLGISSGAGVNN